MFQIGTGPSYNRRMGGLGQLLPRSVAQLTGVIVAAIVAFGTDTDLFVAIPLGVFAGALATLFISMSEARDQYRRRWAANENYRRRIEKYRGPY